MDTPEIVFIQCRFCLKLIQPLESLSIFEGSEEKNRLADFVQQMLSIEFTAENSHVCGDCFSMWQMIQDYLNACAEANKIVLTSKKAVVRMPWLENEDEKRMMIGVCRVVKRLHHEMEILIQKAQPSMEEDVAHSRKKTKFMTNKKEKRKEMKVSSENVNTAKQEDAVEIDDSAAFQSDKPIEATKAFNEANSVSKGDEEDDDNSTLDDPVMIIELPEDHIDLVDSSSDESEHTRNQVEYVEDSSSWYREHTRNQVEYVEDSSSWYRVESIPDEEVFKTVCQLCGITTSDMAKHLESHIRQSDMENDHHKLNEEHSESDSSSSAIHLGYNPKKTTATIRKPNLTNLNESAIEVETNPLKCNVCGVEFISILTARLHARLHPLKRTYHSKKDLKRVVSKNS